MEPIDLSRYKGHTPGPWRVIARAGNLCDIACEDGLVATVSRWQDGVAGNPDETVGNSLVISDSPNLLAVIEARQKHLRAIERIANMMLSDGDDAVAEIRQLVHAALALVKE